MLCLGLTLKLFPSYFLEICGPIVYLWLPGSHELVFYCCIIIVLPQTWLLKTTPFIIVQSAGGLCLRISKSCSQGVR